MDYKLGQTAASIVHIAYGIQVQDAKDSPLDFDAYDDWFDEDLEFMLRHVYNRWLEEIESDITSDWSTNLSEQLSQQASAQMSADAEAAGLTTASEETKTEDTIPSVVSSDDSLF